VYISQNEHLFHEQPMVIWKINERPSLGGLKTGSL